MPESSGQFHREAMTNFLKPESKILLFIRSENTCKLPCFSWTPAFAGVTGVEAGVTGVETGVTGVEAGVTGSGGRDDGCGRNTMTLLSELKRRSVFKVGAAYAIVAWLLVQVADVVLPTFSAPGWVMQVFTLFIVLGFPLALLLAWAFDMTPEGIKAAADVKPEENVAYPPGDKLNYAILGFIALSVGFLVVDRFVLEPRTGDIRNSSADGGSTLVSSQVRRYAINLGEFQSLGLSGLDAEIALSPDGSTLAYAANVDGNGAQLYLRHLDTLDTRPISGTQPGRNPFFSPDGDWVGFNQGSGMAMGMGMGMGSNTLKKASVRAGSPQLLSENIGRHFGSSWGNDDSLITSISLGEEGLSATLARIPATGGTPEILVTPAPETQHTWPQVLPGGNEVLFTIMPVNPGENESEGSVAVLSLDTGEFRSLVSAGHYARYIPTGHIVFARTGALWAVPFDLENLNITGTEVPIVEGVNVNSETGSAAYAISDDGLLAYARGGDTLDSPYENWTMVWVDRAGNEESLQSRRVPSDRSSFNNLPRLSPNGNQVAIVTIDDSDADIWVHDVARATFSRVTTDPGDDDSPLWSPDGERIFFRSTRDEGGIYSRAANGTGSAELLLAGEDLSPETFSPEGTQLLYRQGTGVNQDIYHLSLDGNLGSQPLIQTEFGENLSRISPDGQWIAYVSTETGVPQVYVRPFPNIEDGKWQISTGGGMVPFWSHDGQELFFWGFSSDESQLTDSLISVSVQTEPTFSASPPSELFASGFGFAFDTSPDGERFLVVKLTDPSPLETGTTLVFVENWFEELKRLAPADAP